MDVHIEVTDAPANDDLALVGAELSAFNDSDVGPADMRELVVFLRNSTGDIQGGCSGWTGWGWLYIRWLWVAPELRRAGHAGTLIQHAEEEAVKRGCHGAHIDTFSDVALSLYKRLGYSVFGSLPDFPVGRTRTFLQKPLSPPNS